MIQVLSRFDLAGSEAMTSRALVRLERIGTPGVIDLTGTAEREEWVNRSRNINTYDVIVGRGVVGDRSPRTRLINSDTSQQLFTLAGTLVRA